MCGGDFLHLPALLLKEIPSTTSQSSASPLLGSGLLLLSLFTKAGLDSPSLLLGLLALLFGQRLSQIWGEQDVEVGQLCWNLLLVHPRLNPGVTGDNCDGPAVKDTLGSACSECCGICWTFR